MKNKNNYLGLKLSVIGACLIFVISCKKDDVGSFTDSRDGSVYKTVKIGKQVWMAENLRYLPNVVSQETGSYTTPYYYVYDYEGTNVSAAKVTANYKTYGVLYNWPAACSSCPSGWHLPSNEEWTQLTDYLGGDSVAGGKLKETGTTHWWSPNYGATNETGFTALPGGWRWVEDVSGNGVFNGIGYYGTWWTATKFGINAAWLRSMYDDSYDVYNYHYPTDEGRSVRCVKD